MRQAAESATAWQSSTGARSVTPAAASATGAEAAAAVPGGTQPAHRRRPGRAITAGHGTRAAAKNSGPDTTLDQVLDRETLAGALQELSPAHRTVLVETFYLGRPLTALARQLGIPPGTVRSRLHYALHALRQQLEDPETATP